MSLYKLLIVDDEPIIVEGMAEMFKNKSRLDLEVYKAGTAMEALNWLERTKIDIVLSDIRMPGLNGLELQREIHTRWPRCKVIFLTGYDDFEYAQTAIRHHGFDYLLKTDGMEKIVQSVERAMVSLREELESDRLYKESRKQVQLAIPALQKQFLWDVLEGNAHALQTLTEQFEEWSVPLDVRMPSLLLIGRVDDWQPVMRPSDRALLLYAIQNIAEEYLSPTVRVVSIVYDRTKLVWLIQPLIGDKTGPLLSGDEPFWRSTIRFINDTVELIQSACRELLKLQISFAVSNEPVPWTEACGKFEQLQSLFSRAFGIGKELLITDAAPVAEKKAVSEYRLEIRKHFRKLDLLRNDLESGNRDAFFLTYRDVESEIFLSPHASDAVKLELCYSILALYFAFLNRLGQPEETTQGWLASRLLQPDSWQETASHISRFAESLFECKTNSIREEDHLLVKRIKEFVDRNLTGDLSLTRIGEVVALNPSYLSRKYKQITGEGLSEYISQVRLKKAKDLLTDSTKKIHEISVAVGFEAPTYFHLFFKKATNMTPQEYRESQNK